VRTVSPTRRSGSGWCWDACRRCRGNPTPCAPPMLASSSAIRADTPPCSTLNGCRPATHIHIYKHAWRAAPSKATRFSTQQKGSWGQARRWGGKGWRRRASTGGGRGAVGAEQPLALVPNRRQLLHLNASLQMDAQCPSSWHRWHLPLSHSGGGGRALDARGAGSIRRRVRRGWTSCHGRKFITKKVVSHLSHWLDIQDVFRGISHIAWVLIGIRVLGGSVN
jgi:hypothetical protein